MKRKAKAKKRGGRPPTLDDALLKRVERMLLKGAFFQDAVEAQGVTKQAAYQWLERGREGHPERTELHARFLDVVSRARAKVKATHAINVSESALGRSKRTKMGTLLGNPAESRAYLAIVEPRRFGPQVRVSVVAELEDFLEDLQHALPPEWYEKALAVAAERVGDEALGGVGGSEGDEGRVASAAAAPAAGHVGDAHPGAGGQGVRGAAAPGAAPGGAGAHPAR